MTEQPRNATLDTPILSRQQQPETSGLKTVTIFVIVLLFHVAGIVGFLVWQATHQNNPDANLTQLDKTHHNTDPDNTLPDNQSAAPTATGDNQTAPAATTPDTITPGASSGDPALLASTAQSPSRPVVMPDSSNALDRNNAASPTPVIPIASTTQATQTPAPTYEAPAPAPAQASAPAAPTSEAQYSAPEAETAMNGSTSGTAYVVKKGDTLARIAHHHHVKVAELKSANHLTTDTVALGEKLIIPAKAQLVKGKTGTKPAESTAGTHAVLAADTAPTADPSVPAPAPAPMATPAPSMSEPAPSPAPDAPVEGGKPYTVVHGDSMAKIAHKFHVTTAALIAANPNITDPAKLAIGDKLQIPPPHKKVKKTPTPAPSK